MRTEGLMAKSLSSLYQPGERSLQWLKLKKDYVSNSEGKDTLDLVIVGGYFGKGRRTGLYGSFLMACLDSTGRGFVPVCKLGSGFSDQDLKLLYNTLSPNVSRLLTMGSVQLLYFISFLQLLYHSPL
jgi:DNA ligase-1